MRRGSASESEWPLEVRERTKETSEKHLLFLLCSSLPSPLQLSLRPLLLLFLPYRYSGFFATTLSTHDRRSSLGSEARASRSARFLRALFVSTSVERLGANCSRSGPIREIRLLERRSVPRRGRRGRPSRVRTPLSERSIESNWFCYWVFGCSRKRRSKGGVGERKGKRRSKNGTKKLFCSPPRLCPPSYEPLSRPDSRSPLSCSLRLVSSGGKRKRTTVRCGSEEEVVGKVFRSHQSSSPFYFLTSQVDLVVSQAVHVLRRAHHEVRRELAPKARRGERRRAEQGRRRGQRRRRRHD